MSRAGTRDRRPPQKGDQRRSALLQSLDQHLQESSFESVNIADISRRAGVTRSAFYFYFENKAAAVAALMEQLYDEIFAVSRELTSGDGTPESRVGTMVTGLFGATRRHEHLFAAMLEARATSQPVREMWDADLQSFVEPLAEMIRSERDGRPGTRGTRPGRTRHHAARAQRPRAGATDPRWLAHRRAAGRRGHRHLAALDLRHGDRRDRPDLRLRRSRLRGDSLRRPGRRARDARPDDPSW